MSNNQWIYHQPTFECDQFNPDMLIHSPWVGHRNFAYDYVCNVKPSLIVELGSYYGCSSFAFLQAIKDKQLNTAFYAIDTWGGDSFTVSDYQEDIYSAYEQINTTCFSGVRSHMVRKTFDEACADFQDGSIDLLHIDGSHNYEDVKNDFTRWYPKVADDGVIFFHDVGQDFLFGAPMGSHIFWQELKESFQFVLEFPFSNGLGLLFTSEERYRRFLQQVDLTHYQLLLNLQDTENKDLIRKNHFVIRDLRSHNTSLQEQISTLNYHLERHRADHDAAMLYQQQLQQQCTALQTDLESLRQQYGRQQESNDAQFAQFNDLLAAKDQYIQDLEGQVRLLNEYAAGKDSYIRELEQQVPQLNQHVAEKESYIRDLEQQIAQLNQYAANKEDYIGKLEQQMAQLNEFAAGKDRYSQELEQQIAQLNVFVSSKDQYIQELEQQIAQLNQYAASKEDYIGKLEQQMAQLNEFAAGKDSYSQELEQQRAVLLDTIAQKDALAEQLTLDLSESRTRQTELESCCKDLRSSLAQEQGRFCELDAAYAQCRSTLYSLIQRIENLPFGKYLLKDLPSVAFVQEDH